MFRLVFVSPHNVDVLKRTLGKNLTISTDVPGGISGADIVFIAVNTGTKDFGHWVRRRTQPTSGSPDKTVTSRSFLTWVVGP
jgi:hypothetical protein